MTPYEVRMEPEAENQLAAVWVAATPYRDAVTAAQDRADLLLASDPLGQGRLRSEGLYRLDVPPLVVFYTVDAAARVVVVTDVYFTPVP